MDNPTPEVTENVETHTETQSADTQVSQETGFSWKTRLGADLANAPTFQKFEDNELGLKKAFESHASLEKLLGHEKVPIPKNADDVEGWSRFSKAMGIPDKAEQYGLADVNIPEQMKDLTFNKQQFAETVHAFKLTPTQAKGLWEAYTKMTMEQYSGFLKTHQDNMVKVVNQLRSEWGDTYEANVDLGQTVINKFAADKETQDYLTSVLTKDPRAIKFLAKIGSQFAENKVGEFSYKRFSLAPEQAEAELSKIRKDLKHPYTNPLSSDAEHNAAVDYVNSLEAIVLKAKQGQA